ncbi:MAG: 3-phosphoshikimate 1-carboxyvinyltransferase [Glaciecola sp.]|jgi:3-phosphoshikimate 1-carboxyvinyltransferase
MAIGRVRVHPGALGGRLGVPGDKSISHRSLLIGALAGGASVNGLAPSGDVLSTAQALRGLGMDVTLTADERGMLGGTITGLLRTSEHALDCGNSGTGMRLLAGICAGLPGTSTLVGDHSLSTRPMGRVATPLRLMGATVETTNAGTPPIVITGGALHAVHYDSPVASAQVKSCVLLAAVASQVTASVRSPLPSRDHTERMLRSLGVRVDTEIDGDGRETVTVHPGPLQSSPTIAVPGDPSSAAFWLVAGALGEHEVIVDGVVASATRLGVLAILEQMGADVELGEVQDVGGEPVGRVRGSPGKVAGGAVVSGRAVVDAIDELPILALAGALSLEGLEVRDAQELRAKESDRITATARSLGALGITVEERPDGYLVRGGQRPGPGTVHAGGDHRIAMTAAIAATLGTGPVEIDGFESVATSYPTFLADLTRLGGVHEVLDGN